MPMLAAGADNQPRKHKAVVVVTSDTCSRRPDQDESGSYVQEHLGRTGLFSSVDKFIEADEKDKISERLERILVDYDPSLIITVGGTGLCPRDVTPEATSVLYDKHCSGIATALHVRSLRYTDHAALSRLTAGIAGATLIVNLPGKTQACKDCLGCLESILEHALEQVRSDHEAYSATHIRQQIMRQREATQMSTRLSDTTSASSYSLVGANNGSHLGAARLGGDIAVSDMTGSRSSSRSARSRLTIEAIRESRKELQPTDQIQHQVTSNQQPSNQTKRGGSRASSTTSSKIYIAKYKNRAVNSKPQANPPGLKHPIKIAPLPPVPIPSVKILQNQSSYDQLAYNECLRILESMCPDLFRGSEDIHLNSYQKGFSCLGCTLAEDLKSKRIVPPYHVSTVDGYVINVPETMTKVLEQVKEYPGNVQLVANLREFEAMQTDKSQKNKFFCCQINTGGRLPKFGFAVVPTEKATISAGYADRITVQEVKQHQFVRKAGSDISEHDVIRKGTVIGAIELSSIIAMGHKSIKILPRPKMGVLSTGDELEDFFANEIMGQDSVCDTNGPMLRSMLRLMGYFVVDAGVAKDDPNELLSKIGETLKKCDVLLITGGASMGTRDHVKDVITHMGGIIHFGRVNIKPGKPAAFASILIDGRRKFIFSLPGNPVSAFITSLVLVVPFLKHAPKSYLKLPGQISQHLGEHIFAEIGVLEQNKQPYKFDGRLEFIRAKIISKKKEFAQGSSKSLYQVQVSVRQQSSRLLSLVDCDCLIMIDPANKGDSLREDVIYPAIKLDRKF